jgi:hypothetical protein
VGWLGDALRNHARELVRMAPDVILVNSTPATVGRGADRQAQEGSTRAEVRLVRFSKPRPAPTAFPSMESPPAKPFTERKFLHRSASNFSERSKPGTCARARRVMPDHGGRGDQGVDKKKPDRLVGLKF